MTHLNIQQGLNIEVVSTSIIKKLYDAALSVSEPLEGELDNAYMSGNLQVDKTYRTQVSYLTTRFPDLHINVTNSYYIPFEDSNVQSVLMANNISSDGVGITEADAATATLGTMFQNNTDITSFDEFKYFTRANTNPVNGMFKGCTNLSSIDLSNVTSLSGEEFKQTGLVNVVLPENITTIVASCFANAYSLLSASAPGVTVIGDRAFDMCGNLTSFSDFSNVTSIGTNSFLNSPLTGVLNAPKLSHLEMSAFKENAFEGIECIGTLSSIPDTAFGRNTWSNSLHYVYLPYECTQIERYAFARNGGLSTLKQYDKTISDYAEGETKTFLSGLKITVFGDNCFKECSSLVLTNDDITNATSIGNNAFQNTLLSGPIALSNLTTNNIAESAFLGTKITSVTLPSTVTSIDFASFLNCTELTTINLSNITLVERFAFAGCTKLGVGETLDINLGSSVSVGDNFAETAYKKLILHGNVVNYDYRYPAWEGMSLLLYLDTSDFHVPSNTTWGSTYGASQLTTVIIHPNYTSWEHRGMLNLSNLQYCIILSPTPPTLTSSDPADSYFAGNNAGNATIYVVDETAKTAYLADAKWSMIPNLSTKIKTLAELPSGVWTTGLSSQYLNS